jgi:2Fe-2S ferredoxin
MTQIIIIDADGSRHDIDAQDGVPLMQTARASGINGIVAECNGNASCATCHVYLEDRIAQTLPPPSGQEDDLLSFAASERRPGSRLSCQVLVSPEMAGMVVEVAPSQV